MGINHARAIQHAAMLQRGDPATGQRETDQSVWSRLKSA